MFQYNRLAIARKECAVGRRVWAIDKKRRNQRGAFLGKAFLVGTAREAFSYMWNVKTPWMYEIIPFNCPCKLYLDIESKIENATAIIITEMITSIVAAVEAHLARSFPIIPSSELQVFNASSTRKLSIHVVSGLHIFDNSQVSMHAYVRELVGYIKNHHNVEFPGMWSWIDLSVYRKNQQYRCVGSGKLDLATGFAYRQLRRIGMGVAIELYSDVALRGETVPFNMTYSDFVGSLVTSVGEEVELLTVVPSVWVRRSSKAIETLEQVIYWNNGGRTCSMHTNGRVVVVDEPALPAVNVPEGCEVGETPSGLLGMIDEDEQVVLESQRVIKARDLADGDFLYCNSCEVVVDKGTLTGKWRLLAGIGTCSARAKERQNGEMFIKCFNCGKFTNIIQVYDQYGFEPEPGEIIPYCGDENHRQLNSGGRRDFSFYTTRAKLLFLDAPMGTGKTHAMKEFINNPNHLSKKVLVITFRISLAQYLAKQFQLLSYQCEGFFDINPDSAKYLRCVICLDSIWRLPPTIKYDFVVLDECTFIMYHFLAGTIRTRMDDTVKTFKRILKEAGLVVCMQHRIPDSSISFYMNCCQIAYEDRKEKVWRRKYVCPVILKPLRSVSSSLKLLCLVFEHYVSYFDQLDRRSSQPCVVFTTRADHAFMVYSLLIKEAEMRYGEDAKARIKGIWGDVQTDAWNAKFLAEPNVHCIDVDVLVLTSVLQAGHSLEKHFTVSFDFLFLGVLTFREELQFISRLRCLGRSDMTEYKYAWVQNGSPNHKNASFHNIKACLSEGDMEETQTFLASIAVPVIAERNDTYNRHRPLHMEEYRQSKVEVINNYNPTLHVFPEEKVKDMTKAFLKITPGTYKSFIKTFEDYDGDLAEILADGEEADMDELIATHLNKNLQSLKERVNHANVKLGVKVLTYILSENCPILTTAKLGQKLFPFYTLGYFLDYLLHVHCSHLQGSYWANRVNLSNRTYKGRLMVNFIYLMDELLRTYNFYEASASTYPIHKGVFSAPTDFDEAKFCALIEKPQYAKSLTLITDQKLAKIRHDMCKAESRMTVNTKTGYFARRLGLKIVFHRKQGRLDVPALTQALCVLKCLLPDEHFSKYSNIVEPDIWK